MKSLLILLVGLFLLTLCCGAVGSFFIFLFDVIRWHLAEKRVIVSASAGSGKTTIMIEKVLRLIRDDNIDVKNILVITFTNAAAS